MLDREAEAFEARAIRWCNRVLMGGSVVATWPSNDTLARTGFARSVPCLSIRTHFAAVILMLKLFKKIETMNQMSFG